MTGEPDDHERARRTFSGLLADLAASPRRPQVVAWERGFRVGEVVADRYELLESLGSGGFGVVFKAQDRNLHRLVAFKAIPPGGHADELVQQEAEVAAQLEHPGLVRLYDFGRCESGAFLVFELLSGETLARRLKQGPIPRPQAVRIALEITRALVHAHAHGVLHRDLKPSNVLLTEAGQAKILDFGLAYYFGQGPVQSGTPGYMAPEQTRGDAEDARTDVYAVGVLLREMVSGERPSTTPDGGEDARKGPLGSLRLERLIARATDPDPTRRPPDAVHLTSELAAIDRRFRAARWWKGRMALFGALLVAGAAAGGSTVYSLWNRPLPLVAVADFENATGDPELDAVSRLLNTSLEQWPKLSVLPRERLVALAASAPADHIPCAVARDAGQRAGVKTLVCGEILRSLAGYSVQIQGVDPKTGLATFSLAEVSSSKANLPALVDRMSEQIGKFVTPFGTRLAVKPIATQTTSSLEASQRYFAGKLCTERPVHGADCSQDLRQALELDPNFAQAAYELAIWLAWNGGPLSEQQALMARAERLAAAAPEKDRMLIQAWGAHLEGDDITALKLLSDAAQAFPEDKQAFYQSGDILRHRNALMAAVPWLEGALALDPDFGWAAGDLAQTLGALGRTEELRSWAARWEKIPGPGTLHGLSIARGWLGDLPGAVEAAKRASVMGAGASAEEDLLQAMLFAGEYGIVTQAVRMLTASGSSVRRIGYYGLAAVESYQGRPRSGLAFLDELARTMPEVQADALYHSVRADYLLGTGDAAAVWNAAERLRRLDPRLAAEHAVSLAYLGDLEHAAILAHDLAPGTAFAETYAALVRLRKGEVEQGLAELGRISTATPTFAWRIAPLFLYGDALAAAGRDAEAVQALQKAQALYLPLAIWRSWAYPRSLLILARSQERLGQTTAARATVDRLLEIWSHAEPGTAALIEARAVRARLGKR